MALYRIGWTSVDGSGQGSDTGTWIEASTYANALTAANNLLATIPALTDTQMSSAKLETILALPSGNPSAPDAYSNAQFKALFGFKTAAGKTHSLSIPSPLNAIMVPNQDVVNGSQADVILFVAQMLLGDKKDSNNQIVTSFTGGRKSFRERKK